MTLFLVLVSMAYCVVMLYMAETFDKIEVLEISAQHLPQTAFSIIVPFRNESQNLPVLIESLQKLNYPTDKIEVIFCNDHSTDDSSLTLEKQLANFPFSYTVLNNTEGETGKKAALQMGIKQAKNEFVVTTDADCIVPTDWLICFDLYLNKKNAQMLLGPVVYESKTTPVLMDHYQVIENAGLIALTAATSAFGKPGMANGANLCFSRAGFFEVGGYQGNEHIPSGDDEFLMQKFASRFKGGVHFVKHTGCLVKTRTEHGFYNFLQQRMRWASKARLYKKKFVFIAQSIVALLYLFLLFNLFWSGFFYGLIPVMLKLITDYFFFRRISSFFNLTYTFMDILAASLVQLFVVPLVGISSLTVSYKWKERAYKV